MAAPPTPKYLSPIVIDTTNQDVEVTASTVTGTATIAAGTYYLSGDGSATDFLAAFETALETLTTDDWYLEMMPTSTASFSRFLIANDSLAWAINWGHANTTFDETILGYTAGSTISGNATESDTSDFATKYAWVGTQAVASDSGVVGNHQREYLISQSRAKSGAVWTVNQGGPFYVRDVNHAFESVTRAYPSTGSTEQQADWMTFLDTAIGQRVRYYPARDTSGTYFDCVFDEATCSEAKPARYAPGVELYSWTVRMLGYVA